MKKLDSKEALVCGTTFFHHGLKTVVDSLNRHSQISVTNSKTSI